MLQRQPTAHHAGGILLASQLGELPRSLQELKCLSFPIVAPKTWDLSALTNLTNLEMTLYCDPDLNYTQVISAPGI